MDDPPVKRRYASESRRRQAEETRRRLVATARRLFHERGYAATRAKDIAGEAGLAVQTFYAVLGSKRGALQAILDELPVAADPVTLRAELRSAAGVPHEQLRLEVDFIVRLFGDGLDVVDIIEGAAATEPELLSLVRLGEERRRLRQRPLVREWARTGALAAGVSEQTAADTLWALTSPAVYRMFVIDRNWSRARVRTWLATSIGRLVLADA
jgi:AcrR family transcriptional regulator